MNGHDTAYDDLLPLDTLRHFARDFLAGFVSIMTTLGFEPKMLASPNARAAAIARRQQRQLVVTADATAAAERAAADRADTDDDGDDDDDSSSSSNSSSSSSSSSSGGGGSSGDPGAASPLATSASTASTAISPPPPTAAAAAASATAVVAAGAGAAVAALTASGLPANVPALASSVAVLTPRVAALHRACRSGVVEAVTTALNGVPNVNATDGTGWSALLCAVDSGSVACIKALLKHNADATQRTRAGSGALHLLVKYGASNRQTHSTVAYVKVLTALIEKGAPVTANADGETPLHIACKAANVVAIEHLLKSTPVDVDHRNAPHQLTALHIAARNGFTEITQLLIKHGADVHATCREGADGPEVTAAQLAAQHQHSECERVLRDRLHDAVQFAAALRGLDAKRALALLATHPRLLLFTDGEKRNALHFFCGKADLATVRTLLESPLAAQLVDAVDAHGRTPLHVACATFNYAVIVALLDRATNAGRSCADGSTPLHLLANRAPDKQKLAAQVVEKLIGRRRRRQRAQRRGRDGAAPVRALGQRGDCQVPAHGARRRRQAEPRGRVGAAVRAALRLQGHCEADCARRVEAAATVALRQRALVARQLARRLHAGATAGAAGERRVKATRETTVPRSLAQLAGFALLLAVAAAPRRLVALEKRRQRVALVADVGARLADPVQAALFALEVVHCVAVFERLRETELRLVALERHGAANHDFGVGLEAGGAERHVFGERHLFCPSASPIQSARRRPTPQRGRCARAGAPRTRRESPRRPARPA
jgi:ankyrin repeat protein